MSATLTFRSHLDTPEWLLRIRRDNGVQPLGIAPADIEENASLPQPHVPHEHENPEIRIQVLEDSEHGAVTFSDPSVVMVRRTSAAQAR